MRRTRDAGRTLRVDEGVVPDLAELCRIHEIGLDLIGRSDDIDGLLDLVLDEYARRLADLPGDALDARIGSPTPESMKKLRALVMFATQAAALREKAIASAELKARTALLEEANARLDGVLEALGAGVLLTDASGVIVKANGAARDVMGAGDGATLVREVRLRVPPAGEAEIELAVGDASRKLLVARRPMDPGAGSEVLLLTDVTQRARDVEERVRLAKLSEVMRTLSVLSHKINNPLTALLGRAQILSASKTEDPVVLKAAAVIEESSQRIADLIRELANVVREGRHEALNELLAMDAGAVPQEEA
jgi:signal transduction histidine kinase